MTGTPHLDDMMPPWSYGNRLYRSVWYDDEETRAKLHVGQYRNSSGQIYRSFRHSWPRYRRHVHLTIRRMSGIDGADEIGSAEASILEAEEHDLAERLRLPYLIKGYWQNPSEEPCWVSLDLERFYPNVNLDVIRQQFRRAFQDVPELVGSLLDDLLRFRVDLSGFTDKDLDEIQLPRREKTFSHIPTGLIAAGFLANVALLDVDRTVAEITRENQVAVFRYVDDHIILAPDFERLDKWVRHYKVVLEQSEVGVSFNPTKFEPSEFGDYFASQSDVNLIEEHRAKALENCRLDPRFPTPLMTQTLAKISDVTGCDVELLDDPGQEALLADLEHLMLADFPKTELPPATRVSFAAGKIARVAAERLRPVTEVVDAEHRVYQLKRRLEAPIADLAVRRNVESELASARRQYFAALRRYRQTERRDCRRTFWLLIKAVRDYPEKLRLWQHVLDYCRLSGHRDIAPLFNELDRYSETNRLSGRFIRATILKVISWQLVTSARLAVDRDATPRRRRHALRFIVSVLRQSSPDGRPRGPYFYEEISEWTFLAAVGTVVTLLIGKYRDAGISGALVRVLDDRRRALSGADWTVPAEFAASSGHSLAIWGWWAEAKLQLPDSASPSIVWELVSSWLSADDPEAWSLWKRYPAYLPRVARRALAEGRYRVKPEELGWLLDVTLETALQSIPTRPSARPMRDLVEWVTWLDEHGGSEEFDPRLGEWTSLEIVRQITVMVQCRHDLRKALHPRNFFLPEPWFAATDRPTWEEWHDLTKQQVRAAKSGLIRDARMVPAWEEPAELVREANTVHGLALLLLGLLRRDFRWPAVWNPIGQQRAWVSLARRLIESTPCSSWTASILEACLTSRPRESLLMRILPVNSFGDDDTTNDPPEIGTLQEMVRALSNSQRILQRYQLSVKDHAPRQLVPIRLDQMTRRAWTDMEDELTS
jgi:hypothetical protein